MILLITNQHELFLKDSFLIIFSTFAIVMEIKIETTKKDGKILAYDGDELVGQLEFSFDDNMMRIEHTYAFKEGIGIGGLLVSTANDYEIKKGFKVLPVCAFAEVWYRRHPQFADLLDENV